MSAPVLLQTEQLTRAFGSLLAVDRVDLTIRRGELRSIIGPNGAGKTTLFRLISGEIRPTGGCIRFDGREITGLPRHHVARLGIAKSYQITNVFPHLSVLENVRVVVQGPAQSFDFWSRADRLDGARDRAVEILARVRLERKAGLLAAQLSHGEQRHLELAIALASNPTLLLLDEPTAGMSPEEADDAAVDHGHRGAQAGPGALPGRGYLSAADARDRPARHRVRPRGASRAAEPDRAREPAPGHARRPPPRPRRHRPGARLLPPAPRAHRAQRALPLRRPAADAGRRPRPGRRARTA